MIRTAPLRWLFNTGHMLIWTLQFVYSNCSNSVTTQHWTHAHMDFCIRWFELPHFDDYLALDTCSYLLLDSLIRTTPFRWLLSTGYVLIWTFAFAETNCSISVTTQHWTHARMDLCFRWFELIHFGEYLALDTFSYGLLHSLIRTAPIR
jgi:hypothetical protein